MKRIMIICLFFLAVGTVGYCGQKGRFTLFDGNIIEGEIVSFLNGIYTINTVGSGQVQVGASKIRKLEMVEENTPADTNLPATENTSGPSKDTLTSEADRVKTTIANNPQLSTNITALAADPDIQEILKDPEIVKEVQAGNIQALLSNKKFMELVNNPKIQELSTKIKEQNR